MRVGKDVGFRVIPTVSIVVPFWGHLIIGS